MKLKINIIALMAFFCLGYNVAYSQEDCYQETLNDGIKHYNLGNFEKAIEIFKTARICPDYDKGNDKTLNDWIEKCNNPQKQPQGSQEKKTAFNVSPPKVFFDSSGGKNDRIEVTSSDNSWQISDPAQWYSVQKSGNNIVISCESNNNTSEREHELYVNEGNNRRTITIFQKGAKPELKLSTNTLNLIAAGEKKQISVTTNMGEWEIITTNLPNWCIIERDGSIINITCRLNADASNRHCSIQVKAKDKTETIQINQAGTLLDVSPLSHDFFPTGGERSITVATNSSTNWLMESNLLPDWIVIKDQSTNGFTIVCSQNSSTSPRNTEIQIRSGNVIETIKIRQPGEEVYLNVNLNTNTSAITFSKSGGNSKPISVKTNFHDFEVDDVPSWCKIVSKTPNGIVIFCEKNKNYSRNDYFLLKAGNKVVKVNVNQESGYKPNPFNLKSDYITAGFSVGYIQKNWTAKLDDGTTGSFGIWDESSINGVQVGIRTDFYINPDKFGLGVSTGLFYEYYYSKSETFFDETGDFYNAFKEHSLYLPLHLIYRYDFSEDFGIFLKGGLGIDYGISAKYDQTDEGENSPFYTSDDLYGDTDFGNLKRFNLSSEFGGGFQIKRIILNVSISKGLLNQTSGDGYTTKQNKGVMASLVYMF